MTKILKKTKKEDYKHMKIHLVEASGLCFVGQHAGGERSRAVIQKWKRENDTRSQRKKLVEM